MTTLRRILVALLILVALGFLCWGIALYVDWPLWMALALFLAIVGGYLLLRVVHRLYVVVRVRSTLTLQSAAQRKQERLASPETALRRNWRRAVATLRASSLRRFGNPLYVLPWYMIIGQSGTGKTTALTRARLSSPIARVRQGESPAQTANYDWWYFDEAIVVDCAGRYVAADDADADRKEWNIGLDLLAKYRSREGINGLVLAISADRLVGADTDQLQEEGQVVRQRIDQLIRLFGKRFPIYLLVTKCDLIYGFEGWVTALPRDALKQALGYLDDGGVADGMAGDAELRFIGKAMHAIGERLRALRLALLEQTACVGPDLLLFPNELAALEGGLAAFARAALGAHPYLETPLLRGLFFSSGQQQGGALSRLADRLLPTSPVHNTTNAGLFLHDFFGKILPGDRHASQPALAKNPWIKVTENLGLVAWLLLTSALCIALTVGFLYDVKTLDLIAERYPFTAKLEGQLDKDLNPLQQTMETLVLVERRNQSRFNSLMADTDDMVDMERRLREKFVGDFRKYVLNEEDLAFGASLAALSASNSGKDFAQSVRNHVRYINLIEARRKDATFDELAAMPQQQRVGTALSGDDFARLQSLIIADLAWTRSDDPYLATTVLHEQTLLNDYAYGEPPFAWLPDLADTDKPLKDVEISDFWRVTAKRPAPNAMSRPGVPAVYTRAGQQQIERFFAEMQTSVSEGQKFLQKRSAFEKSYREQRLKAWQQFAGDFPDGDRSVIGEAAWRGELGDIAGGQSPYFALIDRLAKEFAGEPRETLPGWLALAAQLANMVAHTSALPSGAKGDQIVATINAVGGKAIEQTVSGSPKAGERTITGHLAASAAFKQYLDEINALAAEAAQGKAQAYRLAADFHGYGHDPAIKESALNGVFEQLAAFKKQMTGAAATEDQAIWRLLGGPLRFVAQYVEEQASCAAQTDWEAKVLFPLQSQSNMKALMDELYGQKGSVWAFADGTAKPFLQRNSSQYQLIETAGFSLPFTPVFLPALNNAAAKRLERIQANELIEREAQQQQLRAQKDELDSKQKLQDVDRAIADNKQKLDAGKAQSVKLKITALPTNLNPDALLKPYATILSIQCASGARKISNFNFQVSDTVTWAPGQCGDVDLQIKLGDLVLSKKYPGASGLYAFLTDFRKGSRQFYADEFPAMKGKLDQFGIRQISVNYQFDGADALIAAQQQRETLLRIERDKTAEKQRLEDEVLQRSKQSVTSKLEPPAEPPLSVRVPIRVGMCWAADEAQQKQELMPGQPVAAADTSASATPAAAAGGAETPRASAGSAGAAGAASAASAASAGAAKIVSKPAAKKN